MVEATKEIPSVQTNFKIDPLDKENEINSLIKFL